MTSRFRITSALLLLLVSSVALADEPQRQKGISMHFLPKRVADIGGQKWGLTVDFRPYLKPESSQPVLQTAAEVVVFAEKQDAAVRQNGVWIVVTNPDAYSSTERKLIEDVKAACKEHKLPLFIARASELPHGWQRADQ